MAAERNIQMNGWRNSKSGFSMYLIAILYLQCLKNYETNPLDTKVVIDL
jgi:hypothetical protein